MDINCRRSWKNILERRRRGCFWIWQLILLSVKIMPHSIILLMLTATRFLQSRCIYTAIQKYQKFENIRKYNIRKYKTFGKTIKKKLYISDEKERYFHIYYSDQKACAEHEQIEAKIDRMTKYLNGLKGEKATVGDGYKKYFKLEIYEDDGTVWIFCDHNVKTDDSGRSFGTV